MVEQIFTKAFPGFLSIRDTEHKMIYMNDYFKEWIGRYVDINPIGKTNMELAELSPPNVAKMFIECYNMGISWEEKCTGNETIKKTITFESEDGIEANTQYFDVTKTAVMVGGTLHLLTVCYDITAIYQENISYVEMLKQIACVDQLTQERSFFKFKEDAQHLLSRTKDVEYALVKLDIENFKLINKTFGIDIGDNILKTVSLAIKSMIVSEEEVFSRITVDEFIILYRYYGSDAISQFKVKFMNTFHELLQEHSDYNIKFKFGECVIGKGIEKERDINEFYELVNFAHCQAKQSSEMNFVLYDEVFMVEALRQKEVENRMAKAIEQHEFVVFLQPKYCLEDNSINGAEALVRWKSSDGKYMSPNDFIPVLERNGFITQLDMYMLDGACKIISGWITKGIKPVHISVNFSRQHLKNKNLVAEICKIVDGYNIPRHLIEVELTETAIFDNYDLLATILKQLHLEGFTMSMDDFGSGYSSLGLLKNLDVDAIKIDRSFFVKQESEERSKIVLGSVIDMAKKLGIFSIAEGVEEQVHIDLLRELGCDTVQGYYFAKPMPAEEMEPILIINNNNMASRSTNKD